MGIALGDSLFNAIANLVIDRILEIPTSKNSSKNRESTAKHTVFENRPAHVDQAGKNDANPFAVLITIRRDVRWCTPTANETVTGAYRVQPRSKAP